MKPILLFVLLLLKLVLAPAVAVQIESWKTDNGVPVLFIETHHLPIVDLRLGFRAASSRDGDLPGIAKLVNGLLVEGTAELSAQQIALEFEQVGALLGHQSNRDMAWTGLRSLSDSAKLDAVVDLLGRVTALPSFPLAALERDRRSLLANLAERQKRIASIASDHFNQALYENHPYQYSAAGQKASIEAITIDDLVKFHRRYYVAENASLAIVGDLTMSQAKHYANRVTRYLPEGEVAAALPVPKQTREKTLFVNFATEQSRIKIGMPLISRRDPDYFIFMLGNHVLGGNGSNSRLMQIIREERGLSYDVYSYIVPMESLGA
ncbi:MAG: insulinase family protein, partial [Gammaproteobacteria bacterium]|nr:insulinase family protein [Gammaproteobacteria bacterium]